MRVLKTVLKQIREVKDILCNQCGNSCQGEIGNFNGLIEASVIGNYDSTHINDGDLYEFSLCEDCLVKLFKSFKHPALQSKIKE